MLHKMASNMSFVDAITLILALAVVLILVLVLVMTDLVATDSQFLLTNCFTKTIFSFSFD